jgi:phage-related protein
MPNIFENAVNTVTAPFKFVGGLASTAWNAVTIPFKTAWGGISKGFEAMPTGSLWGFVAGAGLGVWNAIKGQKEGKDVNILASAVGTGFTGALAGAATLGGINAALGTGSSLISSTAETVQTGAQTVGQLIPSGTPATPPADAAHKQTKIG